MNKLACALILLLTFTLLISGCSTASLSSSTPTAQTKTAASSQTTQTTTAPAKSSAATTLTPQSGGTLTVITYETSTNLGNPRLSGADITFRGPCVEYMLRMSDTGEYIPFLAEKYKIAPDGKSITLNVRKGVKFHDGSPLNASAAKYSLEQYKTGYYQYLKNVSSIDIIDDYTIKLNLPQWDWGVLNALTTSFIFSEVALKSHDEDWTKVNMVGTGPYKFASFARNVSVKYVRNEDYWGGRPYLDKMEIKMMADATTALMAFKAKEGQLFQAEAKDASDLIKAGYNITTTMGSTAMFYFPSNNPDSPFADLKVRQAFSYAIDRETIAKSEGYGFYIPTYQPWSPKYWAYSNNVEGHPFNQAKAKQLLTDAGYPNGFQTIIYAENITNFLTLVQDYLKKVGIDAKIQIVQKAQINEMVAKGYDKGLMQASNMYRATADPSNVLALNFMTLGKTRVSSKRYPELEALTSKIAAEKDIAKRKALLADFNKMAVDTHCGWVWTHSVQGTYAWDPKVQGLMREREDTTRVYANAWLMK